MEELGIVEQKVLDVLLHEPLTKDRNIIISTKNIADKMGYKEAGGTITYALKALELRRIIVKVKKNEYRVLI